MDIETRNRLKTYFEFEERQAEIKNMIASLEQEKNYILNTLKATTITDMPTVKKLCDISDVISKTDEIDTLIYQQTQQLQLLYKQYIEAKGIIDMLTPDEIKILEGRVYCKQVFVISRRINMSDANYYKIRKRIEHKTGISV